MSILDKYIIKKFFSTYFFALLGLGVIIIIFDISERIDDFVKYQVPISKIIFNYYCTFVPYLMIKFSSLFTFIAVIFFTSKLAAHTEFIAMLSNGISFLRIVRSYMIAATVITLLNLALDNFLLPEGSKIRYEFTEVYLQKSRYANVEQNIHRQIKQGSFAYMESFNPYSYTGSKFSLESFSGDTLLSKLTAETATWDSATNRWKLNNYWVRTRVPLQEKDTITVGTTIDTVLVFNGKDLSVKVNTYMETMNYFELEKYIDLLLLQGSKNINGALLEKHKRIAYPMANLILTMIGLTLSSRKVRGGTAKYLIIGIALSFGYIFFQQFSNAFVNTNLLPASIAVWIPNVLYILIAIYLYKKTPK